MKKLSKKAMPSFFILLVVCVLVSIPVFASDPLMVPSFSNFASKAPQLVQEREQEGDIFCHYANVTAQQRDDFKKLLVNAGFTFVDAAIEDGIATDVYSKGESPVGLVYDKGRSVLVFIYPQNAKLVLPNRDKTLEQISCPYCVDGYRILLCSSCGGSGRTTVIGSSTMSCFNCNGSGHERCYTCFFTGKVTNPDYPRAPLPSGQIPSGGNSSFGGSTPRVLPPSGSPAQQTCAACQGSGIKGDCSSCDGSGRMKQTKYAPDYGGGGDTSYEVEFRCPACSGSGKIRCLYCGGTGSR